MPLRPDLERGASYEHTYGRWIEFFRRVAESPHAVTVADVPAVWWPFLCYLGATLDRDGRILKHFPCDQWWGNHVVDDVNLAGQQGRLRDLVEHLSSARPELADALYKSDVLWRCRRRRAPEGLDFNVAAMGAFTRPEVLAFVDRVATWRARWRGQRTAVIVPCAADKPYPAPMHAAVMDACNDVLGLGKWHMLVASGVTGVVPRELWDEMPVYDSGIPNEQRVQDTVANLFLRNRDRYKLGAVVYSDFYGDAVAAGLERAGIPCVQPIRSLAGQVTAKTYPHHRRDAHVEYIDLRSPAAIRRLRAALRAEAHR